MTTFANGLIRYGTAYADGSSSSPGTGNGRAAVSWPGVREHEAPGQRDRNSWLGNPPDDRASGFDFHLGAFRRG